ncbi:MAG: Mut7-C RNAse domain-containing protein [Actinomycetota bacterium]|nr:Mut7-C RNAse domain-containing protein [Actinomycetota bacterium]
MADRMLGRLVRYLRMIGYDVAYPPTCPDSRLIAMARSQGRVLLTCDRGITRRISALMGNPQVVEIKAANVAQQIAQLAAEKWIERVYHPRCASCNTPLRAISPMEARHLLPPFTMATQISYIFCPCCNMVFWRGSHWRHFMNTISLALSASPER